jgi:hypothetical protein
MGALLVTGACVLAGCSNDNPAGPSNTTPTPKYVTASTPENVLANLEAAYETRDSVAYKTVYDSSYTGTSTDNAGGGGQVLTFTYSDEIGSLANMARSSTISSVTLDLGGNLLRQASDDFAHPEYAIIMTSAYRIEIIDGGTYYTGPSRVRRRHAIHIQAEGGRPLVSYRYALDHHPLDGS